MLHSLDIKPEQPASTVRKGFKWADLVQNEEVELCVCSRDPENHKIAGHANIIDLWFGRFKDIPARLLRFEHEVRARDYNGLLDSMKKAYGKQFTEDEPVTIIVYQYKTT